MTWPARMLEAIGSWLAAAWPKLRLSRMAIVAFLLGTALLTVPEQTRDVVADLPESGSATAAYLVGVFSWGMALWFWARWALTLQCGLDRKADRGASVRETLMN